MRVFLEGKNWHDWYELGQRQEKGSALGAALQSYESARELKPDSTEINESIKRVAKHFTHIEKYRKIIEAQTGYTVGEKLEIWITGRTDTWLAEVVTFDTCTPPHPRLKAEGWPLLDDGDYIIKRKL